mmetsp:Transcript_18061/g.42645  ORF Transcript_18061/g.42645 Transcript_18061/m.42645 type:complete len:263 (+) Transcript_18061:2073-2861(+)
MADHLHGRLAQHVVFFVAECLGWRHHNTFTSVDSKRIKVLHVADGDTVVISIAHNFILDFLPPLHALFDEDLRSNRECLAGHLTKVGFVLADTTSKSTKSKGRADHEGESNLLGSFKGFINGISRVRLGNLFVNFIQAIREELTIFSVDHDINLGSENLDSVLLQCSRFPHFNGAVQCGLSTHGNHDTVGFLLLDNFFDVFGSDGQEEDVISLLRRLVVRVGLDRGDVGVDQNNFDAFFFQSLNGLSTRVVKLSSLSNGRTT